MPYTSVQTVPGTAYVELAANVAAQEVVAAVTGKKIRVVFGDFDLDDGAEVYLLSGVTQISHTMTASRVWQGFMGGHIETAAGEALKALVTGGACRMLIRYVEV